MRWSGVLIQSCCAVVLTASTFVVAADEAKPKPDAKPASKAAGNAAMPAALKEAIDALVAEYEPQLKSPTDAVPRVVSDYFGGKDSTSSVQVTQAELITTLGKRLHRDPRIDAYVKWQLLSVQKGPFEEAHVKDALRLYQRSPQPPARPGADANSQRQLTNQIAKLRKDDIAAANEQWKQQANFHMLQARPMLGYRDELYARLPRTVDVLGTAMNDLNDRMNAGYDIKGFLKIVLNDVRGTAAGMAAADIGQLAGVIKGQIGKMGPRAFEEIEYDEKTRKVSWKLEAPNGFDKRSTQEAFDALELMAKAGG